MSNEIVLQHLASGLLTITMNRPERRNALNADMTLGLVAAARRAARITRFVLCCSRARAARSAWVAT
jgi:enoyl-CoA hydratase/carnithine racemase